MGQIASTVKQKARFRRKKVVKGTTDVIEDTIEEVAIENKSSTSSNAPLIEIELEDNPDILENERNEKKVSGTSTVSDISNESSLSNLSDVSTHDNWSQDDDKKFLI